jgi:hypothetical protein
MPARKTTTRKKAVKNTRAVARTTKQPARSTSSGVDAGAQMALSIKGDVKAAQALFDPADVQKGAARAVSIQDGWPTLSPRGSVFRIGDNVVGEELEVVVLEHTKLNRLYLTDWDPNSPSPPDCEAIAPLDGSPMGPPDWFAERQAPLCKGCPMNSYGSKQGRRSKACGNYTRLAVAHISSLNGGIPQFALAHVSPTSGKFFAVYLNALKSGLNLPPQAVVTELSIGPGMGNAPFTWAFKGLRVLTPDEVGETEQWLAEAQTEILRSALDRD